MTKNWDKETIRTFAKSDDFHISPFYDDGKTYGTPTFIWSVVVDDQLYVRAWNGVDSRWYKSAATQKAGRIIIEDQPYEVVFEPLKTDVALTEKINQAYSEKYKGSAYLPPMIAAGPIEATVRVSPK